MHERTRAFLLSKTALTASFVTTAQALQKRFSTCEGKAHEMKPRVLIIDDDIAITQQLFWTLCDEYEVMTANDLQSAIRRATIYEPEVSILDLHLSPLLESPEAGMRVLEFIKSRFPHTKVLIVSSDGTLETQRACFEGGADGFLDKPFEVEQLLSTMRRYAPGRTLDAF